MKLNDIRPNIETSGELEEQFFSIQDQGMIFDILRNKMYSNPILAICREISCNARDAHREIGTPEVPVHIHIPNALEPFWKVKDFGPGISPDRMSNIFIKYTASTKRMDNVQTGGFGLGAKTPFSYSDTFTIVTNHDGKQYNYACFIDETKVGKLALLSESVTTEPNGTEIIIPVKPADYRTFTDYTEQATRHWSVRPIIKGGDVHFQDVNLILQGNKWAIAQSKDYNRYAKMIIDGIEYPLEMETLRKYADGKLIDSSMGNFLMYFDIGELSLSASREQIYLDKQTQDKIRERLNEIHKEIRQKVEDKISTLPNLWAAQVYYRKELKSAFHDLRFLGTIKWKDIELNESYVQVGCPVFVFTKGKYSRRFGTDPNKLSRSTSHHIAFEEHTALFVNDLNLKEPSARHVKKAFDDDASLKLLAVICPTDKITIDSVNASIHLDRMDPKMLSSITKASSRAQSAPGTRLVVFKFDAESCSFRQVSYSSIDEDTNQKVLCKLDKDHYSSNRDVVFKSGKTFPTHMVRSVLRKVKDVSVYGVASTTPDNRIQEDFSDLEDIEKFIEDSILNNKNIDYLSIAFASRARSSFDDKSIRNLDKMRKLLTNADSIWLKRTEIHHKLKEMHSKESNLLDIYETVKGFIENKDLEQYAKDHPEYNLPKIAKEYDSKYPLLQHLMSYDSIIEEISQYINMCDKI